jgi:hypothetical protein
MIVRSLDQNGDWEFGAGKNSYKRNNDAVAQSLQTRLSCFVGNCFFDLGAGINWFHFLSSTDQIGLRLALSAVILNTPNPLTGNAAVLGIHQLGFTLNNSRTFSIQYRVQTVFSTTTGSFQFDLGGSL